MPAAAATFATAITSIVIAAAAAVAATPPFRPSLHAPTSSVGDPSVRAANPPVGLIDRVYRDQEAG